MGLINSLLSNDHTLLVLGKSLDLGAHKAAVAAQNIANAETPGYKANRFEFESVLQDAIGARLPMTVTNGRHLVSSGNDIRSIRGVTDVDLSRGRIDGNNVDMDKEMVSFSEAQISYEAAVTALSKRVSIVKSAITDAK